MFDLVIRGGTLVDGSGDEPKRADVAISDGQVAAVGDVRGEARETLDAEGRIVTPGFVDIHTHYDGQATWDPLLAPSSWHGVTTIVMGNCGVGFAPANPDEHDWLIGLMEGVEDIPGTALAEGIDWDWESFPEYIRALEKMDRALDVGTQIPHGALRTYVMGERGARNEPATPEDVARMAALVKEAVEAGALGFSTSRTLVHRAVDGEHVPGTFAAEDELFGIGRALKEADAGLFELAPCGIMGEDISAPDKEVDWMRRLSAEIGRPVTYGLVQHDSDPEQWKRMLELADAAVAEGAQLFPQVGSRPTTILMGLQTFHPLEDRPTYRRIGGLPLPELVAKLRDPEIKRRILSEEDEKPDPLKNLIKGVLHNAYAIGDPPDYEPDPATSVAAIAKREGRSDEDVLYNLMLQDEGRELVMTCLLGYSDGDLDAVRAMLEHPRSAFGLGDGGAHCGAICDASMTTFLLTHWARDRKRGERLPLEWVVRKMTRDTARLYGLRDRGLIAPGFKADLNVIDFERLVLRPPQIVNDLPARGKRFVQRAEGYDATIVSGAVTWRGGEHTGALPGRVIRGAQPAPE